MKKILIDLRTVTNNLTGIGEYTLNYALALLEINKYIIYGVTDQENSEKLSGLIQRGLKLYTYRNKSTGSRAIIRYNYYIGCILRDERIDLFWQPNYITALNMKWFNVKTKVLITIHDMIPITHIDYFSWKYRWYFRVFLYLTITKCDGIAYISETTRKECFRIFPIARKRRSILTMPVFNSTEAKMMGLDDRGYFLFIGTIERRKGIGLLLDGYADYLKQGGTKELFILGKGKDNDIVEMIEKFEIPSMKYFGYVSSEKKKILIENCSAIIFPSYAEGFGIPPMEGLIYGKPIILSNIPVFKEIYSDIGNFFNLDVVNKSGSIGDLVRVMFEYEKPSIKEVSKFLKQFSNEDALSELFNFIDN